ncbi:hypothetical protein EV424DRAFT_1532137 [Suillus variegatus]|nr:hypothetical protein EV424DRAFT_1532137 [Suillus variegatus]
MEPNEQEHLLGYVGFKVMFERCSALEPCLKEGKKNVRHSVRLRPDREGSPRVDVERILLPLRQSGELAPCVIENAEDEQQEISVVHVYGIEATSYRRSEVLSLLENVQAQAVC